MKTTGDFGYAGLRDVSALAQKLLFSKFLKDESDETMDAIMVLIASLHTGPNANRISYFTGINRGFVRDCARRLRHSGVWCQDGTLRYAWCSDDVETHLYVHLLLDSLVAVGAAEVEHDDSGEPSYRCMEVP